jgi:ubiquinone/menaquinone biosynthesis C-methylase UbiE
VTRRFYRFAVRQFLAAKMTLRVKARNIQAERLPLKSRKSNMADFHRGFEDVDQSADDRSFFQFLDLADQLPSIAEYRERMLDLCPVTDKSIVLDVGCGLGSEATRIACRLGKTGMAYGVDTSEAMITEARRRTRQSDLPLQFQTSDAQSLTFEDASFDVCRAERVFLYLENPAMAIAEMARVTRRGGHVIVFDFDYGTRFIDSDFAPMTRHIEALLAGDPRNPAIGRELPHLMRKAKLKVDTIEPVTLLSTVAIARRVYAAALARGVKTGVFTAVDVEAWWREQEAMEQDGRFYHAQHGYIVAASKP